MRSGAGVASSIMEGETGTSIADRVHRRVHRRLVFDRRRDRLAAALIVRHFPRCRHTCSTSAVAAVRSVPTWRTPVTGSSVSRCSLGTTVRSRSPASTVVVSRSPTMRSTCCHRRRAAPHRRPHAVLAEARRVTTGSVVLKDHFAESGRARFTLGVMDWVGNRQFGVGRDGAYLSRAHGTTSSTRRGSLSAISRNRSTSIRRRSSRSSRTGCTSSLVWSAARRRLAMTPPTCHRDRYGSSGHESKLHGSGAVCSVVGGRRSKRCAGGCRRRPRSWCRRSPRLHGWWDLLPFTAHRITLAPGFETDVAGVPPVDDIRTQFVVDACGGSLDGRTVVDLGCLEGGFTLAFAQRGAATCARDRGSGAERAAV